MGFDGCGNHRTYSGKSTFDDEGEFVNSKQIMYAGMAMNNITLDNEEETEVYKVKNFASSDNERPILICFGQEDEKLDGEIMKFLDDGAKEAHSRMFEVNYKGHVLKFRVHIDCCQLDGKTHKIVQGRGGAWCLLCTTPKDCMKNVDFVKEGFPMDMGIKDLWENFYSVADETMEGDYYIDNKKIPTEVRAGATGPPLAEHLELGWFLPPLHCYLRFLAFFVEMAERFRAENNLHGEISDEMKEAMKDAKKAFREDALINLEKRYEFPDNGGSSSNGNAARHFFSYKMREKVIKLFEMPTRQTGCMDSSYASSDSDDLPESVDMFDSLDLNSLGEEPAPTTNIKSSMSKRQRKILPTLLKNVSVILRVINSDEDVNVEAFEDLCKETNIILIEYFKFMNITPTVHAVLAHSFNIIRNNKGKGLKCHSEEGSEGSHKVLKFLREHGGRKMSLELNMKDVFRKMFFRSDPIVRNMKRKVICSRCEEEGHSIRSCPEAHPVPLTEDDILFESVTYKDLTSYDYLNDEDALDKVQNLESIFEEEAEGMEQEVSKE